MSAQDDESLSEEQAKASEHFRKTWFDKELTELPPGTREVLEGYSEIPSDKVLSHVHSIVRLSISQPVIYLRTC